MFGVKTLPLRGSVAPAVSHEYDVNIRKNMYASAVLSGGTNMFSEAVERVTKELRASRG